MGSIWKTTGRNGPIGTKPRAPAAHFWSKGRLPVSSIRVSPEQACAISQKKAGVSVGNFYNHFPGRDDLIAEIAQIETAGLAGVVAQVTECADAREAIDRFTKSYFTYCADPVSAVLTIEITSEALRNPAIENLFSGNRAMLIDTLAPAIVEHGQNRAQADEIAGLILDTIEGFALRVGLTGRKPRKQETQALISFVRNALTPEND